MLFRSAKFSPAGMVEIEASEPIHISSKKNAFAMIANFRSHLISLGWRPLSNDMRYYTRPNTSANSDDAYEYCVLEIESVGSEKTGFFGKSRTTWCCEAKQLTPHETVTLESSSPSSFESAISAAENIKHRLIADGWEELSGETDILMKKVQSEHTAAPNHPSSENSTETLKKLAELRDAGVLTEKEFQDKKTEILNRL